MPPKKNAGTNKKSYKKNSYNSSNTRGKSYYGKAYKSRPSNGLTSLFPTHKIIGMTYSKSSGLVASTTESLIGVTNEFSLNSIYRPDVSSNVDRPQGYDQLKIIYDRYKVMSAYVTVTFNNPSQDGLYGCVRVRSPYDSDTMFGEKVGEAQMKRWTVCLPLNNTGSQKTVYKRKWMMGPACGITSLQHKANVEHYASDISASPLFQPFISVGICNSQDNNAATMNYTIKIVYVVELHNRHILPNSITTV